MPSARTSPLHPSPPRTVATGFRVPGVDGLRALAVAAVVVYHLGPGVLDGGFLGVDVFFVISGFLITSLLLREREGTGRIRLSAFWARRARRLLPALALLVLVCGAAAALIGGDLTLRLGWQVLGAATFSSNWILIAQGADYFTLASPELFRNLWSLAVEEQFYLVWPLVVLVLALVPRGVRATVVTVLAALSIAAMALLDAPGSATRVYFGTDTHSFGLALGALVAVLARGRMRSEPAGRARRALASLGGTAALAGLGVLAVLLQEGSSIAFRGGLAAVAVLTAAVLGALLVPGTLFARALEWSPLRWVGVRSYGIYLWHWPALLLVAAALPDWRRDGPSGWALGGIALALTLVAAVLSYRCVERPIRRDGLRGTLRRMGAWARRGPGFAALAGAAALLVVAAGVGTTAGVLADPGRSSTERQVQAGARSVRPTAEAAPSAPASAAPLAGDQIVVVGDSVTLAAAPELESQFPGILVDAAVSRQMREAPRLLGDLRATGRLRPVVVLALGTNGGFPPSVLDDVRGVLGPGRELVVVNTQAPRGWEPQVNQELADFAQRYRDVELANWHDAIQPDLAQLNRDQIHFGGFGARVWTAAVKDALQRLAELPPARAEHDWAGVPRPG